MSDGSRTVALDASVLINLIEARRMDVLEVLAEWRFVAPDQVVEEIQRPEQVAILEVALRSGRLERESSTDPIEIGVYADLRRRMGRGEAACLAMAQARGWSIASDDRGRAFRRLVRERIGEARIFETGDLVRLASERGPGGSTGERRKANDDLG